MFWGILSVLVGAWLGYAALRNLFFLDWRTANARALWFLASLVPSSAMTVYFVWLGRNELRRAGGEEVPKPRFRWGRLLLGFCLVFFALKGHFAPGPNTLKADNDTEALGMFLATVVMVSIGTMLMAFAFRPAKPKPIEQVPSIDAR
jgi:hypothetical protein